MIVYKTQLSICQPWKLTPRKQSLKNNTHLKKVRTLNIKLFGRYFFASGFRTFKFGYVLHQFTFYINSLLLIHYIQKDDKSINQ